MKVAISLPDPLFSAAEQMAEELHVSRSQLYAQALSEYLDKRHEAAITQCLNTVYRAGQEGLDPALNRAQLSVLGDEAW